MSPLFILIAAATAKPAAHHRPSHHALLPDVASTLTQVEQVLNGR
jgi:hypothetical protein